MTADTRPRVPASPPAVRRVRETRAGEFPLYVHPEWQAQWPWLVQGTTGRGEDGLDLGLFGDVPVGLALARWRRLREATHTAHAVHARQVHGARIIGHDVACGSLLLCDDADGHVTRVPDLLLTVSVADCVPIFLVAPHHRTIALLHGGWRGVAAGILDAVSVVLTGIVAPSELHLHCGPAICGDCYEVGPEVVRALGHDAGDGKARLDVRAEVARRALALGIPARNISVSEHCTRCGEPAFWSHRAGCRERQMGVLAIRP